MATKTFVSPGVFTAESDMSFLPAAVGAIGAAYVGRMPQGPAFVPYRASTYSDASNVFGDLNSKFPMTYGVKSYMTNAGTCNIVRVLGPSGRVVGGVAVTPGYAADSLWSIVSTTGSNALVHAFLELTGSQSLIINDLTNDLFDIRISGSNGYVIAATASFLTSSTNYIRKVLNTDPTQYGSVGYFLKSVFDYVTPLTNNGNSLYSATTFPFTNFQFGFNSGSTTWINSQEFGGGAEFNLFRVHTLGHGSVENGRLKISFANITPSPVPNVNPYGKFDVYIRSFTDTDRIPVVLESFPNCTLDPTDTTNYLPLRIGDRFFQFSNTKNKIVPNGNFPNISKLVRIEMTTGSFPQQALPWGFRGLPKLSCSILTGSAAASASINGLPDLPLVADLKDKETQTESQSYIYWGIEFQLSGGFNSRLAAYSTFGLTDQNFSLKNISGSIEGNFAYNTGTATPTNKKQPGTSLSFTSLDPPHAQFSVPTAFGFDGFDVRLSDPLQNETQLLNASQLGTQALRQGVDCISDPDFIDINMLVIPGIWAPSVTNYAIQAVENRGDAFYITELSGNDVGTVVTNVANNGYNSNYTAVYYPPVKIVDPLTNMIVQVPASIPAAAAIAYNDRVAYPWYAPAGLNRGGLNSSTIGFTVVEAIDRLISTERDLLYTNRVNPIASFPAEGIVIWGQKTLQQKASALDRVNVRRLLIQAKKLIASAGKYLLFEANNAGTWQKFLNLVNPILLDIQVKNGLQLFKVVMDSTTNTPALIDQNIMSGQIFLVPTRTAEELVLNFIVSRTGATFSE